MLAKPDSCTGCELHTLGQGWVYSTGPEDAELVVIAEAPGKQEAAWGVPLYPTGDSGGMFNRWLGLAGLSRDEILIHNVISCRPPNNELVKAPYAEEAIRHCRPNLERSLSRAKVVLTLGGTATREILQLPAADFSIKDWHGCVTRDPTDRFWVVPNFHPAHLVRGAHALMGVAVRDVSRAKLVRDYGWEADRPDIIVDPPVEWFRAWADEYIAAATRDPSIWMAVDTETEEKLETTDEGELKPGARTSNEIVRYNFSMHPDQGVSVPAVGPYLEIVAKILGFAGVKCFWYRKYDLDAIQRAGIIVRGTCLDFMWAWHVLQSDLPRGLGFVAPLFSNFGAWKHRSRTEPGPYAAIDGFQTLRCAAGIAAILHQEQRWETFYRHCHLADEYLFWPSCKVGLLVDRKKLEGEKGEDGEFHGGFKQLVDQKVDELWNTIQAQAPQEVRRLDPPGGLKTEPKTTERKNPDCEKNPGSPPLLPLEVMTTAAQVKTCTTCGASERITLKHVCKGENGKPDRSLVPVVVTKTMEVRRWFIRRQFNPNSSDQMLDAVLAFGHKPGKSKRAESKTGYTVDKLTLERLRKHAQPPETRSFYAAVLEYREVKRIKSGYVDSTLRRLDESEVKDGRLHPEVTHRPSTLRTSYINPNLQNIAARSALSEGFREVLVAEEGDREEGAGASEQPCVEAPVG